ncbi:UV radiation resistance protein and autophagy-related subunit 14-domain-containing protein [Xylariomycetidae sp. FL2044]|nr:UV radiation resistance protein and autophagy-related subunit 14-domain-containing protein [Xylariomycetidae sp. FL2044]
MSCDICQRAHHPKRLPFFCIVDARNALYEGRVANARVLMEMEELESRVNNLLLDSHVGPGSSATDRSSRTYLENCVSEEQKARDRTERIIASADKLRDEVAAAKKEIEEKKSRIANKKSDLAAASQGITARRSREMDETRRVVKMTKYTWNRDYEAMAQYRAALCMEVAKLYRLQRTRRGSPRGVEYRIGGIEIIDLHSMHNVQPEHISAFLGHITHLLWLTAHYLAIRLPAEITLPHKDYPRPTIFSLASSYHHGDVAFPGSSPLPPDSHDRQFAHVPHPRPLFIDKPLSTLAREDQPAYISFLEAVCLLSYDIIWLCRTQGVPVGDSPEDFFFLGRNMYNLLINSSLQRNPQQMADAAANAPAHHQQQQQTDHTGSNGAASDIGKAAPRMGSFSHGTAHTFLGSATGTDLTRSFKLPNLARLVDTLKAKLLSENPIPEWEVLEDDAWTPDDALDDGVLVGGAAASRRKAAGAASAASHGHGHGGVAGGAGRFGIESYMSVSPSKSGDMVTSSRGAPTTTARTGTPREKEKDREREREKGTNGWTKIKPR